MITKMLHEAPKFSRTQSVLKILHQLDLDFFSVAHDSSNHYIWFVIIENFRSLRPFVITQNPEIAQTSKKIVPTEKKLVFRKIGI